MSSRSEHSQPPSPAAPASRLSLTLPQRGMSGDLRPVTEKSLAMDGDHPDLQTSPFEGMSKKEQAKSDSKKKKGASSRSKRQQDATVHQELEKICDRRVEVERRGDGRGPKITIHPRSRQVPTDVASNPREKRGREEVRGPKLSDSLRGKDPKGRTRKATRTTKETEGGNATKEAVGPRPAAYHARLLENLAAPRMYIGAARIGPLPLPVRVRFSPHSTINLMSTQMAEWLALQQDPLPTTRRIQLPDGRRKEVRARVSAPTTLEVIGSSPHDEVVTFDVVNDEATGIVFGQGGCATFQLSENISRTLLVTRGQITRGWLDHTSLDA